MTDLAAPVLTVRDRNATQAHSGGDSLMICSACQSARCEWWGEKHGHVLARCLRCGAISTRLRAGSAGLSELYERYYYYSRFEVPPVVLASLEQVARIGEHFRRSSRWLDIGFGEGAILRVAERNGWQCYGTDIAPQALAYGEQRGWVVAADAEQDARFPAQGFDVVTMFEFLEHVPDPERFLQAAARWLRPGGALYLTTPNAASINRRLLGPAWSIFSPPEHLTIWTARGVSVALAEAGLQPQQIRTEGFNPAEIWARWRRSQSAQVNRNQAGFAINQALSRSPWRRAVKAGLNRCLSRLRVGDSLKVWAVKSEAHDR